MVNLILGEERWPFEFLVENQWWPGFTFTEPEETARLLEGIRFAGKGILLDTGHLMNACTELKTEAEGADYIRRMLNRHGSLAKVGAGRPSTPVPEWGLCEGAHWFTASGAAGGLYGAVWSELSAHPPD